MRRRDRRGEGGVAVWAALSQRGTPVYSRPKRDGGPLANCSGCFPPKLHSRVCQNNNTPGAHCEVTYTTCQDGSCQQVPIRTVPQACPSCYATSFAEP
jgi:hypothetical protein